MEIIDILKAAAQKGASDIHLVIVQPPMIRVDGGLQSLPSFHQLTADESRRIIYTLLSDPQRARFEQHCELDYSMTVDNYSPFRATILLEKRSVAAVRALI